MINLLHYCHSGPLGSFPSVVTLLSWFLGAPLSVNRSTLMALSICSQKCCWFSCQTPKGKLAIIKPKALQMRKQRDQERKWPSKDILLLVVGEICVPGLLISVWAFPSVSPCPLLCKENINLCGSRAIIRSGRYSFWLHSLARSEVKMWQVKGQGQFSICENLVDGQRIDLSVKVRQVQRCWPQTPGSACRGFGSRSLAYQMSKFDMLPECHWASSWL